MVIKSVTVMVLIRFFIVCAMVGFSLTGCLSARSYLDTTYPKVSYDDVQKKSTPMQLRLDVEFQRNGEHLPKADKLLRDNAERVLRASGVITPVGDDGAGVIRIVLNDTSDHDEAVTKGVAVGSTLGLVGATVTDSYEMSVTITVQGATIAQTTVKHALRTAIGKTTIPKGAEVMSMDAAFQQLTEQMLLRALQDIQNAGELAWLGAPRVPSASAWAVSANVTAHKGG
jgi:hypothetical protein